MVIKINGIWHMTRVDAYKRYHNTIKPIEDLLKYLGWED